MPAAVNSCLYECTVFHRRLSPRKHELLHRVFMFLLDLDELEEIPRKIPWMGVENPGLYSFYAADHFAGTPGSLRKAAEEFLAANGCEKPGRILLLTNLRFLGYTFNPISVWYCFRQDGSPLAAIAEVGNTFGELKPYFVPLEGDRFHTRTPKHFYVSPFTPLDYEFDFRFGLPGENLFAGVDDYHGNEKSLISTLTGERRELTSENLLTFSVKYPLITLQVIFLIHWHALLLWRKKIPFFMKEDNPGLQKGVHRPHVRR